MLLYLGRSRSLSTTVCEYCYFCFVGLSDNNAVLPFYWLGQVALLAYQEGLPPFQPNSPDNLKAELRFKLVKQWLKHIRAFLKSNDEAPTLFWDELMKLRLKSWQMEFESDFLEDQDGLLGFFAES